MNKILVRINIYLVSMNKILVSINIYLVSMNKILVSINIYLVRKNKSQKSIKQKSSMQIMGSSTQIRFSLTSIDNANYLV